MSICSDLVRGAKDKRLRVKGAVRRCSTSPPESLHVYQNEWLHLLWNGSWTCFFRPLRMPCTNTFYRFELCVHKRVIDLFSITSITIQPDILSLDESRRAIMIKFQFARSLRCNRIIQSVSASMFAALLCSKSYVVISKWEMILSTSSLGCCRT
ncbi:hypothetical protein Leryth_009851 [Lithospermum erythrorhizon]|nr:hypothetical protein Leryth_009851 [Lithospermum erythrorhizon]